MPALRDILEAHPAEEKVISNETCLGIRARVYRMFRHSKVHRLDFDTEWIHRGNAKFITMSHTPDKGARLMFDDPSFNFEIPYGGVVNVGIQDKEEPRYFWVRKITDYLREEFEESCFVKD